MPHLTEDNLAHPSKENPDEKASIKDVVLLIWNSAKTFFHERPGQIIGSAFILIMLWGYHGNLDLFRSIAETEWFPKGIIEGIKSSLLSIAPWYNQLLSFWAGFFFVVFIPILIIKFGFKQKLSDYGLALPSKGERAFAFKVFLTLTLICLPFFWIGAGSESMQKVYPFYKNFTSIPQFAFYELTYLPFFIAIEFIFRGYLLFGLAGVKDNEAGVSKGGLYGVFYFSRYAILIQMLSYTAWHLGKPIPELWGTPLWGIATGVCALKVRSIWPGTLSHWLLNIFLDAMILWHLKKLF